MTPEEKDTVRRLVIHITNPPPPSASDMDHFWHDYGYGSIVQEFPYRTDPHRAWYLEDVTFRAARMARKRQCKKGEPPPGEWWWCGHCERRYWDEYPNCIYCSANCDRWTGQE